MKKISVLSVCVAMVAVSVSCDRENGDISVERGKSPDRETLANTYGMLRSAHTPGSVVSVALTAGGDAFSDNVYYRVSHPLQGAVNMTAEADLSLVGAYNEEHGTSFLPLPAANVTLGADGALSIPAGQRKSGDVGLTISAEGLEAGTYLLPVKVSGPSAGITQKRDVVDYMLKVRVQDDVLSYESWGDEYECTLDTEWTTVFYVNVNEVQPLLADQAVLELEDTETYEIEHVTLGNIVVMRNVTVGRDAASGRALLYVNSDMRYVLEHAGKYIRPLQEKGRKVLVCIQGADSGFGFCNMNDTQIADFAEQTAALIETYKLDGVNLWDEYAGYGKAGMPAVNTTSYPKLIKAIREALPDGCLLTLTDKGDPTASFHDTSLTGGIAVGDYLDYAWSGYWSYNKVPQFIYPWSNDNESDRKPIAGLDKEKYGNVMLPCYPDSSSDFLNNSDLINITLPNNDVLEEHMSRWSYNLYLWGIQERSNNILVFPDLPVSSQAPEYESGYITMMDAYFFNLYISDLQWFEQSKTTMMGNGDAFRANGYGTFGKDW